MQPKRTSCYKTCMKIRRTASSGDTLRFMTINYGNQPLNECQLAHRSTQCRVLQSWKLSARIFFSCIIPKSSTTKRRHYTALTITFEHMSMFQKAQSSSFTSNRYSSECRICLNDLMFSSKKHTRLRTHARENPCPERTNPHASEYDDPEK